MTENVKTDPMSSEVKALEIASQMVLQAYPHAGNAENIGGKRWQNMDTNSDKAIRERLELIADLIGDIKNRLLK